MGGRGTSYYKLTNENKFLKSVDPDGKWGYTSYDDYFKRKASVERQMPSWATTLPENQAKWAEAYEYLAELRKKENLDVSKSPYSDSYYLKKGGQKITWGYKPEKSYRLSDHWNWDDGWDIHCATSDDQDWGIAIGQYRNGKYYLIKKF